METMFWVWIGVIVATVIIEGLTMDLVSIWFTAGAIVPLILSACKAVSWEIQVIIFIVISALLIITLRKVTKKLLLRNSDGKTNLDSIIGNKYRMLTRTDFETLGSIKINDVIWTAVGEKQETIEKDAIVEVVSINGNKLKVKEIEKETNQKTNNKKEK